MNRSRKAAGAGFAMIELMVAMTVLTVGLVGLLSLILSAMASNNRNKLDSSGTLVAQGVVEQIAAQNTLTATTVSVTDCAGNTSTINTAGTTAGTGATVTNGAIDYTQAVGSVPAGYQMYFVTCDASNNQTSYDVRWNITNLDSVTNASKYVVVAARYRGTDNAGIRFATPVTLRTIVGQTP